MNTNDNTIRLENNEARAAVENLIRESFWNVYRPGCSEHYVIHVLRDDPAFVKELDFVMEQDGRLIGQNMFMRTCIQSDDGGEIPVLTMGPICITPELKRKGYGKKLLDYSLEKAAAMGFGAVLFEGNIGFYGKSGFTYARRPDTSTVSPAYIRRRRAITWMTRMWRNSTGISRKRKS